MGAAAVIPKQEQDRVLALHEHYQDHFADFAYDCETIADKAKQLRPLDLSPTQKILDRWWNRIEELNQPIRFLLLKPRQAHFSTYVVARIYWMMWRSQQPLHSAFIGDVHNTTESMRIMFERFHDNNPLAWNVKSTETFRDKKTGKMCSFLSANSKRAGQGSTPTLVHGTEVPYWKDGEDIQTSLYNPIPKLPGTVGVYEGTANSFDPFFQPKYVDAIDHVDQLCKRHGAADLEDLIFRVGYWDGAYIPFFVPWFVVKEYVRDPEIENVSDNTLDNMEIDGIETHGWNYEQIAWRRYMIREELHKKPEMFNQEYPSTWEEAFQFSKGNRSWFPIPIVKKYKERSAKMRNRVVPVVMKWKVRPTFDEYGHCNNLGKIEASAYLPKDGRKSSEFMLFKPPALNRWDLRYCMGVDVAQGLEQGDYSVLSVMDRVTAEFVFKYRGHVQDHAFHEIIAQVGMYYGGAHVLIEANNMGGLVISNLMQIYPEHLILDEKNDLQRMGVRSRRGHYTTFENKRIRLGDLLQYVEDSPEGLVYDENFWHEGMTFTISADGRHIEAEKKHENPGVKVYDDDVMSKAFTLRANQLIPPPVDRKPLSRLEKARTGRKSNLITNLRDM